MPKNKLGIVTVPNMNYIAVRGHGDPNAEDGEYKQSISSYDGGPATAALMHEFMEWQGYTLDITDQRLHYEIYLSDADARMVAPERLKTVVRHPIRER